MAVDIRFSRHARRRMALYDIPESRVLDVLQNTSLHPGKQELIADVPGIDLPLKIVFAVENEVATVITAYPLKKGRRK